MSIRMLPEMVDDSFSSPSAPKPSNVTVTKIPTTNIAPVIIVAPAVNISTPQMVSDVIAPKVINDLPVITPVVTSSTAIPTSAVVIGKSIDSFDGYVAPTITPAQPAVVNTPIISPNLNFDSTSSVYIGRAIDSFDGYNVTPDLPSNITITKEITNGGKIIDVSSLVKTTGGIEYFDDYDITNDSFFNNPIGGYVAEQLAGLTKTIISNNKFESLIEDGSYSGSYDDGSYNSIRNDTSSTVIIKEETPVIIEQILTPIGGNVDKTAVTDMVIPSKYFNRIISINDRKHTVIDKFSFEYLSFLFFEVNINESIPNFYTSVSSIIDGKRFVRDEDYGVVAPEDQLDDDTIQMIFSKIWNLALASSISVKNLIGFYIYFNRRLNFLPILVQGDSLNEFIADLSLESIVNKLMILGLYPVNGRNLFERLWNSFVYSVKEDGNKSEVKMSIGEYYHYDVNRNMAETYDGFPIKKDELGILYDLELGSWSNKRSFNTDSVAFKRFKELSQTYINTGSNNTNTKYYLKSILPSATSQFLRVSLANPSSNPKSPNRDLWCILQTFDEVYKINRLNVNKRNVRKLFIEFASSNAFPVGEIENNNYVDLWVAWVSYLNAKASAVASNLINAESTTHNYTNMYVNLVDLVNSKFILQYLKNNDAFQGVIPAYVDGTNYVDAALLKTYQSMDVLKQQLKDIIKYITTADRRFYSANVQ